MQNTGNQCGILNRFFKNGPSQILGRTIVCDTETTGLSHKNDRLIEFGAIELLDMKPTGRQCHIFIEPEGKIIDPRAVNVHGITNAILREKEARPFRDEAETIADFLRDCNMVAHNAQFDFGFLKAEFERMGVDISVLNMEIVDTIPMAKMLFPGKRMNLDALCRTLGIGLENRTLHGALIDSVLLKDVYLKMIDIGYAFSENDISAQLQKRESSFIPSVNARPTRNIGAPTNAEIELHKAFLEKNRLQPFAL